eukprot:5195127-Karenia_brevis.AAC.1
MDMDDKVAAGARNFNMSVQDMESVGQEAGIPNNITSFLITLAGLDHNYDRCLSSPATLEDVVSRCRSKDHSDRSVHIDWFWRHLDAYQIRGRQPHEDASLFKMCCEVRNGPG